VDAFSARYNATVDLVDRHVAEGRGARLAYRDDRGSYSYAELSARVDAAGGALAALGIEPEQRVLLLLLDTIDFPAVFLGALKLGAVPVPVSTMLTPADYAWSRARPRPWPRPTPRPTTSPSGSTRRDRPARPRPPSTCTRTCAAPRRSMPKVSSASPPATSSTPPPSSSSPTASATR
jgi:non-ribosomal peptide synthetase component F